MAQINFNVSDAPVRAPAGPIPEGWYKGVIVKTDVKATKAGTGQYLETETEIIEGQYKGRKVWDRINYRNPSATAQRIGQEALRELCESIGVAGLRDTVELHNRPFAAKIGIERDKEGQYDDKNTTKRYAPVTKYAELTGNGSAAAAPAAPAAASDAGTVTEESNNKPAPPWAKRK